LKIFFFLHHWGLNSGLHTCKASALTAEATPPVHFALVILETGFENYLLGLASNLDPLDVILPSSWDYRCEAWHPAWLCSVLEIAMSVAHGELGFEVKFRDIL
jgi:hypothetical protein